MQITTYNTRNSGQFKSVPTKRIVDIPENQTHTLWEILEQVFLNGQNEVQPGNCPSVSVGDTIIYETDAYLILSKGFFCLTTGELIDG
jgi:hypothetical protein